MKVILNALKEDISIPQPRWWGHVNEGVRYLLRYGHAMLEIHEDYVTNPFMQTKTDKVGVLFAIKHLNLPIK